MLKKILTRLGIFILLLLAVGVILFFVYVYPFMTEMKKTTTVKYDPNLTIVLGGGGNSGILASDSVVLVIDTKMDEAAENLAKTVKEIAGRRQ
jgi:hypothetical protein